MSFFEIQFPTGLSYGAVGGPGYSTDPIVVLDSGFEQRNVNWSVARAVYDVAHGIKHQADMDILIAFFRTCQGKAHGFRFKDWVDFQTTHATGVLGLGVGTGGAAYQLQKRYLNDSQVEYRAIKKPVANPLPAILRGGVAVTYGGGAGQVALNSTTGIITFVSNYPSAAETLTWQGEFDTPCRFDTDIMKISVDSYEKFSWGQIPVVEIRV